MGNSLDAQIYGQGVKQMGVSAVTKVFGLKQYDLIQLQRRLLGICDDRMIMSVTSVGGWAPVARGDGITPPPSPSCAPRLLRFGILYLVGRLCRTEENLKKALNTGPSRSQATDITFSGKHATNKDCSPSGNRGLGTRTAAA